MKTTNKFSLLAFIAVIALTFNACKKDDPIPEVDQEEFSKSELVFFELEEENGKLVEHDTALVVKFDAAGDPDKSHYHIDAGHEYRLYINLYDKKGNLNNDEILEEADEHQVFFPGAPADVLNYTYEDNIGMTGVMSVLKETSEDVELQVVLRHGLKKSSPIAAWNTSSADYAAFGGADDLNVAFELHPVEGDHDH